MRYYIILTNCDCASNIIAKPSEQYHKWIFGPRCPGCHKILGWMQWRLACEETFIADGELGALRKYREGKKKE